MDAKYTFNLPAEEKVIERNRTITTYYAQLYQNEPTLYKWAGMAAFASFHIGEKLSMWDWDESGIKSISHTCKKQNRSIEDDFQVIRIINNKIFAEIGTAHLAFSQLEYSKFRAFLLNTEKDMIILNAFEKLNQARKEISLNKPINYDLIWEANIDILWHEQLKVVQPLFDKLSYLFSGAMTLMASFDYNVNHSKTNWKAASRFISFMILKGFNIIRKNYFIPNLSKLEHRWHWISKDLLVKWRMVEEKNKSIKSEINTLSQMADRNLKITRIVPSED